MNTLSGFPAFACLQYVLQTVGFVCQVVDYICVVPEYPEILCGSVHRCEPFDHIVGIRVAGRVAVLGVHHIPFMESSSDASLSTVSISAVIFHIYSYHFYAKKFTDGKMPVIAGTRAEELHFREPAPGRRASVNAEGHGAADRIVHHTEARVIAHDDFSGAYPKYLCKQFLRLGQAVHEPVIAYVRTGSCFENPVPVWISQHFDREVKLLFAWLPP